MSRIVWNGLAFAILAMGAGFSLETKAQTGAPSEPAQELVKNCNPETLGQMCEYWLPSARQIEPLIGVCEWKRFHFFPSCELVEQCSRDTLGANCLMKGDDAAGSIGMCEWRPYHFLPDCYSQ